MEHVYRTRSLDSELFFICICSVEISSRNRDIFKKPFRPMIPPDLLAQQIHAVQTLGYPPSPRGPYVRPCYFIRPDQGQVIQARDFCFE